MLPGSYLLTIIAYFIFFHEGIFTASAPAVDSTLSQDPESPEATGWLYYWPYLVILGCFIPTMITNNDSIFSVSLLLLILAITIMPFFTGYYWSTMGGGFLLLLVAVNRMFKVLKSDEAGGASFISSFFYMMAAFFSIVIYAVFF